MLSRRRGTRIYEETSRMKQLIRRLWTDDSGQDLVEYALLLVLLKLVVMAALRSMGPAMAGLFSGI